MGMRCFFSPSPVSLGLVQLSSLGTLALGRGVDGWQAPQCSSESGETMEKEESGMDEVNQYLQLLALSTKKIYLGKNRKEINL